MAEKIEVTVLKQVMVEAVDGGLFFVSVQEAGKATKTERKAATSQASLFKMLTEMLGLEKQKRGPRKPKEGKK